MKLLSLVGVLAVVGFKDCVADIDDKAQKYLIYIEKDAGKFPETVEEFREKYEVYRSMAMLTKLLSQPQPQKQDLHSNWTLVIPKWSTGPDQPDALDDVLDDDAMELFVQHEDFEDFLDDYRELHRLKKTAPVTVSMALMSSTSGCPTPAEDGLRSFDDIKDVRAAKCLKLPANDMEDAYTRVHMLFEIISLSNSADSLLIDSTALPRPGKAVPSYDEPLYWRQRRSLRPSGTLRKIANAFRNKVLDSDDVLDGTLRPGDWRGWMADEEPQGGPYISTWVDLDTDMHLLGSHLSQILQKRKLKTVYLAGDVEKEAASDLENALGPGVVVAQFDESVIENEPQMKKVLRKPRPATEVSLHLIDAWIAAHAREFVGRPCSPDTQLVAEERLILGFPVNSSHIFPYTDEEENCPTFSIQMLDLAHDDSDEGAKAVFDEKMERIGGHQAKESAVTYESKYRKLSRTSRKRVDVLKAAEELSAMGQVLGMPAETTEDLEAIADVLAEAKRTATKKQKKKEKREKKKEKRPRLSSRDEL